MAQTASIAPGLTAANSAADINVPASESWTFGIYTDDAGGFQALGKYQSIVLLIDTPSAADTIIATLTKENPTVKVEGKCTVRARREAQPAGSVNIGLFYNDNV